MVEIYVSTKTCEKMEEFHLTEDPIFMHSMKIVFTDLNYCGGIVEPGGKNLMVFHSDSEVILSVWPFVKDDHLEKIENRTMGNMVLLKGGIAVYSAEMTKESREIADQILLVALQLRQWIQKKDTLMWRKAVDKGGRIRIKLESGSPVATLEEGSYVPAEAAAKAKSKKETLQQKYDRECAEREQKVREITELRAKETEEAIAALGGEVPRDAVEQAANECKRLKERKKALEERVQSYQNAYNQTFSLFARKKRELAGQVEKAKGDVQSIEKEIEAAEEKHKAIKEKYDAIQAAKKNIAWNHPIPPYIKKPDELYTEKDVEELTVLRAMVKLGSLMTTGEAMDKITTISRGSVSSALRSLERKGFVQYYDNKYWVFTDEGEKYLKQIGR